LYLDVKNFESVAYQVYVVPCSTSYIVRASISKQLRLAAQKEVAGVSNSINVSDLYGEADQAFTSLSTLLGDDTYFFGGKEPSLFDASVFAYTHLILDVNLGWEEDSLGRILRQQTNLVQHRDHIMSEYFSKR
jgi:metaxin